MLLQSKRTLIVASLAASMSLACTQATAIDPLSTRGHNREPSWTHGVVRVGEERDAIKSMPITDRPYRPLHFYGNTVRRVYYRGTPIPAPRDIVGAGAATILRK